MTPPRFLIAVLLLAAAHGASAKQVTAKMGVVATVVYPAIIKINGNNAGITVQGMRTYSVVEKYEKDGSKVIIILY